MDANNYNYYRIEGTEDTYCDESSKIKYIKIFMPCIYTMRYVNHH